MTRKILGIILLCALTGVVAFFVGRASTSSESHIFELGPTPVPTPLAKYSIENIKSAPVAPAEFSKARDISETKTTSTYAIAMKFDPTLQGEAKKIVTGVVNTPKEKGKYPLVVMIRGFVDQSIYTPGVGTKNAALFFAQNGFLTVAPDFLGYAGSDSESGNIFETRFQTYTTMVSLLNSLATPSFDEATGHQWDGKNVFIWAHSNGGQVALTTLAITGVAYPTTLWAPVTKPFPYSVLYYTDESADGGKFIRRELSKFETLYDVDHYTFTNYLSDIKAPIQFSQGTADDAIPVAWTNLIVSKLKKAGVDITYHIYPGADHNMRPSWDAVVLEDLKFFQSRLK